MQHLNAHVKLNVMLILRFYKVVHKVTHHVFVVTA